MFDAPFDVFAVMIAIAAFLIALKASNQATELRRRAHARHRFDFDAFEQVGA